MCQVSEFRTAVAHTCAIPQSEACASAVERAVTQFGIDCISEPLFKGAPPLSLYVCPGSDSALMQAECRVAAGPAALPGPGPAAPSGPGPAAPSGTTVARIGIGSSVLVAIAGRYGLVPGRPGRALTRKFGTDSAKERKARPYIDEALGHLRENTSYKTDDPEKKKVFTGNTLIPQADYNRALVTLAHHTIQGNEIAGIHHASTQIQGAAMRSMGSGRYVDLSPHTTAGPFL